MPVKKGLRGKSDGYEIDVNRLRKDMNRDAGMRIFLDSIDMINEISNKALS